MTSTTLHSSPVEAGIPQYSRARVRWIWAAAALPMGALAWVVAPAIAGEGGNLAPVLMVCLAAGLIWQFVLILLLNGFSLRKPMGAYHLHQPWSIPTSNVAGLLMAYPTKRWRSAWMGIIVHSTQSVFLAAVTLALVLT